MKLVDKNGNKLTEGDVVLITDVDPFIIGEIHSIVDCDYYVSVYVIFDIGGSGWPMRQRSFAAAVNSDIAQSTELHRILPEDVPSYMLIYGV